MAVAFLCTGPQSAFYRLVLHNLKTEVTIAPQHPQQGSHQYTVSPDDLPSWLSPLYAVTM